METKTSKTVPPPEWNVRRITVNLDAKHAKMLDEIISFISNGSERQFGKLSQAVDFSIEKAHASLTA